MVKPSPVIEESGFDTVIRGITGETKMRIERHQKKWVYYRFHWKILI